MAYCKNCINAVESNLPEGGLYCTLFRSLRGDTIGCSSGVDGERKAKTNADRIRSMTDEELAHLLHSAEEHLFTGNLWNYEKWAEWLKQEVSDET